MLASVRAESATRQALVAEVLPGHVIRTDPAGFDFWRTLTDPWTRSAFAGHTRSSGISVVPSDAFAAGAAVPEAVRVCLGGPADRANEREALDFMAHALEGSPSTVSSFLASPRRYGASQRYWFAG